jgi:DtxR family Mn-dependent transcriptional regulator
VVSVYQDKKFVREETGRKGCGQYKSIKGYSLRDKGKLVAKMIVRNHLWEVFLEEKLDFSWDELDIAEQIEHVKSELINK